MPQSSEELRARWSDPEGLPSEDKAIAHLEAAGYTLQDEWGWQVPAGRFPTEEDLSAIRFLIEEWDYAGFVYADDVEDALSLLESLVRTHPSLQVIIDYFVGR